MLSEPMDHGDANRNLGSRQGIVGVAVLLGGLWLCFGGLLGPFDFLTFFHAGQQVVHGSSPYVAMSSSTFTSGHAFVYPAFVAWMFAPLALIPAHPADVLFTAVSAAAVVVACRWLGRPDGFAPALVLVSSTTIIALQMGTVNPLLLLGIAACWRWRSAHPVVAGLLIGAVAAVKLFLAPLLLWPLLARRYAAAAMAGATFTAVLATQTALGRIGMGQYFAMLSRLQGAEAVHSWSATSFLQNLGIGAHPAADLAIGLAGAGLGGLWLNRDRLSDRQVLGLIVIVCLLVSPIVWSSYLVLMAAPLVLLSNDNRALAVSALASWVVVTPDQASALRVGIGMMLAVAVSFLAVRARAGGAGLAPRRWIGWLGVGAAGGALLMLMPSSVRSPLPTLVGMAALAGWVLRRPAAIGPRLA
jgi:hypothetical protein